MEPSALDRSQQLQNEADDHLDNDRYIEAIQCHRVASDILYEELKKEHPLEQVQLMVLKYIDHLKQEYYLDYTEHIRYDKDMKGLYDIQCLSEDCNLYEDDIIFNAQKGLLSFVSSSNLLFRSLTRKVSSPDREEEETSVDEINFEYIPSCYREMTAQEAVELIMSHYQALPKFSELLLNQVENIKEENQDLIEDLLDLEQSKETENPIIPPTTIITESHLYEIKKRCGHQP